MDTVKPNKNARDVSNSFAIVFTESNSYKVKTRLSSMAVMTIDDHPGYVELESSQAADHSTNYLVFGDSRSGAGTRETRVFSPNLVLDNTMRPFLLGEVIR